MRPNFFHHLHPPTIPAAQARWRHTLRAEGLAVFLILVVGTTGILEMFYYLPNWKTPPLQHPPRKVGQHDTIHMRL